MRVVIDGLSYFLNNGDLGQYTRMLINSLSFNTEDTISLIKDKEVITTEVPINNIEIRELSINRINNDYSSIENLLGKTKAEIYHCPNNGYSLSNEYKYFIQLIKKMLKILA